MNTPNITDALAALKTEQYHLNQAGQALAFAKHKLVMAEAARKIAEAKAFLAADGTEKAKTAAAVVATAEHLTTCATIECEVISLQADVDSQRRRRDVALETVRVSVAFGGM